MELASSREELEEGRTFAADLVSQLDERLEGAEVRCRSWLHLCVKVDAQFAPHAPPIAPRLPLSPYLPLFPRRTS